MCSCVHHRDLIIVDGNPLDDISQLRRVETTIKGGVMYDARALYASAGVTAPALPRAG
jgi:hypothetical protein